MKVNWYGALTLSLSREERGPGRKFDFAFLLRCWLMRHSFSPRDRSDRDFRARASTKETPTVCASGAASQRVLPSSPLRLRSGQALPSPPFGREERNDFGQRSGTPAKV